jgi:hypothetical protein
MGFVSKLRLRFGFVPSTEKIESDYANLVQEYNDLVEYSDSDELKRYLELDQYVNSPEFTKRKKEIESQKFKETDEFQKLNRFKQLKKTKEVKTHLKGKDTSEMNQSLIDEYNSLNEFVNSREYNEVKNYMALSSKAKFQQSDEFKLQEEYKTLKNSDKIKWYMSVKDSNKFDELKDWALTFEDDFDSSKLDAKKWLTKYYYGETVINDSYSLRYDNHYPTEGENLEVGSSICRIETKKEKKDGKAWHPKFGFVPKTYNFTSGIINTGQSFRQQYGKFEAKVRMDKSAASHAFWMVGEKASPQINVFLFNKGKMNVGFKSGELKKGAVRSVGTKVAGSKYTSDFMIYTLEWTPERITWKINGLEAFSYAGQLPQEPMYMAFSSGLIDKVVNESALPGQMEIDWVKCYSKN